MTIQSTIDPRSWIPPHPVDPTTGGEAVLSKSPAAEATIAACSMFSHRARNLVG
jgi:hypothetical protein